MFRRALWGFPVGLGVRALGIGVFAAFVLGTGMARAQSGAPGGDLAGLLKDRTAAKALGKALFRDTLTAISDSPCAASIATAPPQGAPGQSCGQDSAAQLAGSLWTRERLEKYQDLIQRAFDPSLWRKIAVLRSAAAAPAATESHSAADEQAEQGLQLIWRVSVALYESTLEASQGQIYTCRFNGSEEFDCRSESEPAIMVPIPALTPALKEREQPDSV